MKQLVLNDLGVQELDARELKETDGGIVGWALFVGACIGVAAVWYAINEWGDQDCPPCEE